MSDQLPPFAVLATQAEGTTLIHEHMYEGAWDIFTNWLKWGERAYYRPASRGNNRSEQVAWHERKQFGRAQRHGYGYRGFGG